eukprot:CAMPEP_0168341646 /NCGR_PEP_ID=MMETSP0213-20121227/14844_1 /TAXON_ID=151035 /ORGANISM="Euplotes harpa, Strain FSP1.4" /LENGTH=111 /DNA_ID=CAMNT_0008348235 /DNA_START=310 /DNA_END=645 /DNA_ORIENTATION=-
MKTEQIYKWGYDRKKAIAKFKKLYPESNGIKTRFIQISEPNEPMKETSENLNDVVAEILDSMKNYTAFGQNPAMSEVVIEDNKKVETDEFQDSDSVQFHYGIDDINKEDML